MAKEKVDTKAKPKAAEKDEPETFKYGVSDIADKLGIDASAVRVKLRNAGIDKAGKSYGWNTKAELAEVIDEISTPAKKTEKPKAKADEKAAPKGKKKPVEDDEKPVKKPKAKKPKDDDD